MEYYQDAVMIFAFCKWLEGLEVINLDSELIFDIGKNDERNTVYLKLSFRWSKIECS